MNKYILPFEAALTSDMCTRLISLFQNNEKAAEVCQDYAYSEINMIDHPAFAEHCSLIAHACMKTTISYLNRVALDVAQRAHWFKTCTTFETPRIRKYSKDAGRMPWHFDACNFDSSRRFLAIVFHLNTLQNGDGALQFCFDDEKYNVNPRAGQCVMYPTSFSFLHQECIPKTADKFVITSFALLPDNKTYITD